MKDIALIHPSQVSPAAAEDYAQEHYKSGVTHLNGSGGLTEAASYAKWVAREAT